jgi:hypothetical protein
MFFSDGMNRIFRMTDYGLSLRSVCSFAAQFYLRSQETETGEHGINNLKCNGFLIKGEISDTRFAELDVHPCGTEPALRTVF